MKSNLSEFLGLFGTMTALLGTLALLGAAAFTSDVISGEAAAGASCGRAGAQAQAQVCPLALF